HLEDRVVPSGNPIVAENQLPGTPLNTWSVGTGDASIQGFATDISVDHGQTVSFKINDSANKPYFIDIYRMGYYQGNGARLVTTIPSTQVIQKVQPNPLKDTATGLVDAGNWSVTASWAVPASAVSGLYFARVTRSAIGGYGSYNSPLHSEYPMIRWLEANGYGVSYSTDVDTDRRGAEIREHKVYLSVGHDEYWSGGQRANVEAARDAGVSLAFFSGNECFWKTRWENSIDGSGTPYRTLVCYKESKANAKIDPSPVWTGTWRDARFSPPADGGRPENAMSGTMYMDDRTNVDLGIPMTVSAADAGFRFWRNTSVANLTGSQTATLGQYTVGYEVDEDLDNGFRPAGLMTMSSTTFSTQ